MIEGMHADFLVKNKVIVLVMHVKEAALERAIQKSEMALLEFIMC
jgi:hypothetical protein